MSRAVAAPETGGISFAVLAIVALVVAVIVGVTVYIGTTSSTEPVMPPGLSPSEKKQWTDCKNMHDTYKDTQNSAGSLAAGIKSLEEKFSNNRITPQEKLDLCELVDKQIRIVQRLHKERKNYIDYGCDKFDWFSKGNTEAERRTAHEGELKNVHAQLQNLYQLRTKLDCL